MNAMRISWVVVAVLTAACGGCLAPYGMNMQTQQQRQLEESRASELIAQTATNADGPPPVVVNQGDSSTATIAPPSPVKYSHTVRKGLGESQGLEAAEASLMAQKNPWTWLLMGAGLILLVIGAKKLWDLVKNTAIGQAAKAADSGARSVIETLKRKMQAETDPAKLQALKDAVLDAQETAGGKAA